MPFKEDRWGTIVVTAFAASPISFVISYITSWKIAEAVGFMLLIPLTIAIVLGVFFLFYDLFKS